MQIALASQPATPSAVNLDWAGAAGCGAAVVLDGLTEAGPTGCRHGTFWYVSALGTRLLTAAADRDRPLSEALRWALAQVRAEHGDGCDLNHPGSPGATVAMVRPAVDGRHGGVPGPVGRGGGAGRRAGADGGVRPPGR